MIPERWWRWRDVGAGCVKGVLPKSLEKQLALGGARVWPRAKRSEALGSMQIKTFKPVPQGGTGGRCFGS